MIKYENLTTYKTMRKFAISLDYVKTYDTT